MNTAKIKHGERIEAKRRLEKVDQIENALDVAELRKGKIAVAADLRAWRRGADLAIELLEEADLDTMALNAPGDGCQRAPDDPQDNLLLRYLLRLREINDDRVDAAFCAVMTDYIAGGRDGGVPDVSLLRRLSRKPIATSQVSHG